MCDEARGCRNLRVIFAEYVRTKTGETDFFGRARDEDIALRAVSIRLSAPHRNFPVLILRGWKHPIVCS